MAVLIASRLGFDANSKVHGLVKRDDFYVTPNFPVAYIASLRE